MTTFKDRISIFLAGIWSMLNIVAGILWIDQGVPGLAVLSWLIAGLCGLWAIAGE